MTDYLLSENPTKNLFDKVIAFKVVKLVLDTIKKNSTEFINIHLIVYAYHRLFITSFYRLGEFKRTKLILF